MSAPLRFCMVTTFYPPYSFGGDAIFVRNLARELAQRGHQVDVVHNVDAYRALGGGEPAEPAAAEEGIRVHALRSRSPLLAALRMHQGGGAGPHAARLRELVDRDYDVVHFHNVSLVGGPRVLELGRGVKLYSLHEWWLICPTHTLFRFGRAACESPRCVACALSYGRPPQLWRWTGALARATARVDAFLAPSRFSVEMHRRRGAELPLVHFPSFSPRGGGAGEEPGSTGRAAGRPYFLFVGRLETLKGPQTLIPHFRERAEAELVITGSGAEEASLRAAARGAAVRFTGWQRGNELSRLYRGAVAVILPSLCYDMFPLVAIEALQHGTPIVARDLGALSEIATESGGGLLYRNESELDAALGRLLAERGLRDRLGASGRAAYLANWTPEAYLERYFGLIRDLRERRARAGGAPRAAN